MLADAFESPAKRPMLLDFEVVLNTSVPLTSCDLLTFSPFEIVGSLSFRSRPLTRRVRVRAVDRISTFGRTQIE